MSAGRLLIYIAATAGTTYLIRMIPLVAIQKKIENRFFRSFLYYVPYAVLAAMIMPDVFYATGDVRAAAAGFLTAMIFAYKEKNIVTVACASCIVAFVALLLL
jgi:branched-subunit amino acid transport protein